MTQHRWWQHRWLRLSLAGLALLLVGVSATAFSRDTVEPVDTYEVIKAYPHDPQAFTQGLVIDDGVLYESTGHYGKSSLRRVDLTTGRVEASQPLDQSIFGEGITALNGKLIQLTWQNRVAIVFDQKTLTPQTTMRLDGEGWGITHDGTRLIVSDGTAVLRFVNPQTFEVVSRLTVKSRRGPVDRLNELEFINGEIYANVWYSDRIARISPKTGQVLGWIDLSTLYPQAQRGDKEKVLNGIAYDAKEQRLFVTGKYWPKLYEIKVVTPKR